MFWLTTNKWLTTGDAEGETFKIKDPEIRAERQSAAAGLNVCGIYWRSVKMICRKEGKLVT